MSYCCGELKAHIRSNDPTGKERPNVYSRSSDENVIPESSDGAAGAKSPRTLFAREKNYSYINESLKRV
jgi:hypothetical protein